MIKYSDNPAEREDEIAAEVRQFYESHRETWGERWRGHVGGRDLFILGIIAEVRRRDVEAERQIRVRATPAPAPVQAQPGSKKRRR